jgi:hypothetical protein
MRFGSTGYIANAAAASAEPWEVANLPTTRESVRFLFRLCYAWVRFAFACLRAGTTMAEARREIRLRKLSGRWPIDPKP